MTKTILVTGANRGIGLEIVKQYAKLGCTVYACCRDPDHAVELQKLQQLHQSIFIHQLDVSNEENINNLSEQLKDKTIDVLFNNAGVAGQDNSIGNITSKDLMSTFKINTMGPILLAQAMIGPIAKSKSKIIVNMSSYLSSIESNRDSSWLWFSYRVSKSGLNAATRTFANSLKPKGIVVISLDPGWVQTDMGGKNAEITTEECVLGLMKTLEKLSLKDSGNFIRYNGDHVPW